MKLTVCSSTWGTRQIVGYCSCGGFHGALMVVCRMACRRQLFPLVALGTDCHSSSLILDFITIVLLTSSPIRILWSCFRCHPLKPATSIFMCMKGTVFLTVRSQVNWHGELDYFNEFSSIFIKLAWVEYPRFRGFLFQMHIKRFCNLFNVTEHSRFIPGQTTHVVMREELGRLMHAFRCTFSDNHGSSITHQLFPLALQDLYLVIFGKFCA